MAFKDLAEIGEMFAELAGQVATSGFNRAHPGMSVHNLPQPKRAVAGLGRQSKSQESIERARDVYRAWREANRAKLAEQQRARRARSSPEQRETQKACDRRWREANRTKLAEQQRARRAADKARRKVQLSDAQGAFDGDVVDGSLQGGLKRHAR